MAFQISALATERFSHLYGKPEGILSRYGVRRITADACPGYPCRVSLRDVELGETLLLLNYVHHDKPTPYRASHAIFVIEHAERAEIEQNCVPLLFRDRMLSVRAFNAQHDMTAAEIVDGANLEGCIEGLSASHDVEYLHIHNAKPGCYAARVDIF